jgi:hypothetical protein
VFNTPRATNSTKSRVFQKLFVILTAAVFSILEISNGKFIKNIQYLIDTEHGRDVISRGAYGK